MASPIEDMLLRALIATAPQLGCRLDVYFGWRSLADPPVDHPDDATYEAACSPPIADIGVAPGALLDGYKVDFLVSLQHERWITWAAVECDGHEWHERTQQQAAYDRARDRALIRTGVITIRFTGSEINRDANQCAREVLDCVRALHHAMVGHVVAYAGDMAREFISKAVDAMPPREGGR